jgi:hypothetical protein
VNRIGLILALALVVVGNTFVLVRVMRNRTGAPYEGIELTERELALQTQAQDNSGVTLMLRWNRTFFQGRTGSSIPNFDRSKLQELGFHCRVPSTSNDQAVRLLPKEAFVALEYEESARPKSGTGEDQPGEKPRHLPSSGTSGNSSRLFPVDAALDAKQLRGRFPNQQKHLIVRGVITALWDEKREWHGYVSQIFPEEIHVPLPYARLLAALGPNPGAEPRYTVTLLFGENLEPWITAVKLLGKKP